jgi:tryptophan halogenase
MKKILVLGTGTAGLISASLIKTLYKDKVDVEVYYDKSQENIGVGEGTVPNILDVLNTLGISVSDLIKSIGTTIKLGIEFKNWIPNDTYFHGFVVNSDIMKSEMELSYYKDESSSCYGIANGIDHGSIQYNTSETTIPNKDFDYGYAIHLDTVKFSKYLRHIISNKVKFIEDILVESKIENGIIQELVFEKTGSVKADFYIDCSGFKSLLIRKLSKEWIDVSDILPIDSAIPQQVLNQNNEIRSNTLAEATANGWIWQIPVGERYGTGYLYSSKFTSDEEARKDYDNWLKLNHNIGLESNRIIRFSPGYFKDFCVGNCAAIGLSSGFIEPLEATGIMIITEQVNALINSGILMNNLEFDRNNINRYVLDLYRSTVDFVSFHYITGRTDSPFWKYMKDHKSKVAEEFEYKCRTDFISKKYIDKSLLNLWSIDSFINVAHGLKMFNQKSVRKYMENKFDSEIFTDRMKQEFFRQKQIKNNNEKTSVSHREFLNYVKNVK